MIHKSNWNWACLVLWRKENQSCYRKLSNQGRGMKKEEERGRGRGSRVSSNTKQLLIVITSFVLFLVQHLGLWYYIMISRQKVNYRKIVTPFSASLLKQPFTDNICYCCFSILIDSSVMLQLSDTCHYIALKNKMNWEIYT